MIFNLSKGLTTVLDAAPAQPPAKKEIKTFDQSSELVNNRTTKKRNTSPTQPKKGGNNSPMKYETVSGVKNTNILELFLTTSSSSFTSTTVVVGAFVVMLYYSALSG